MKHEWTARSISARCIALLALCACCAAPGGAGEFLERDGARLLRRGMTWRCVGINKHELLDYYLAGAAPCFDGDYEKERATARSALARLSETGVDVIRVRATGFWPTQIEQTYYSGPDRRRLFWERFEQMLDDCDDAGLRIIFTLAWHNGGWADLGHEPLCELIANPHSTSRLMLEEWIRDCVSRYRSRETVLFWELVNEANLSADLKPHFGTEGALWPKDLTKPHAHLFADPVVRDERNNYTSEELAAYVRELAILVKSIDSNHLVSTGFSAPRPAAWHMWMGSLRRTGKMDWTRDTDEEQADYLRLITPDQIDLISIHHYVTGDVDMLALYKRVADGLKKPLYIGECGPCESVFGPHPYASATGVKAMEQLMGATQALDVPLVLWWTWAETDLPIHEPMLDPARHPDALKLLEASSKRAASRKEEPRGELSAESLERFRECSRACAELVEQAKADK